MTHIFFSTSGFRVYKVSSFSKTSFISVLHDRFFGGSSSSYSSFTSQSNFRVSDKKVIFPYVDAWIVKVISTLCVLRCSSKSSSFDFTWLEYFSKGLNPVIVFEVMKRLNNPTLAYKFFEFSRVNCEELNEKNHSAKSYKFLVRSLCHIGDHDGASKLVFNGYVPDSSDLGFLIYSCARAGKFDIAKGLIGQAQRNKVRLDFRLYNNLLNLLVNRDRINEAVCFFKEQHLRLDFRPDTYSFNILIKGLCKLGGYEKAFELRNEMESYGCSPDEVTYNTLIYGLCKAKKVDRGLELLNEMKSKTGFHPDAVTFTSVICGYCKSGKMKEAMVLFYQMANFGIRPNDVTYNVLIDGYGKLGDMSLAVYMYEQMLNQGCCPDVCTLSSLLDGYCRIGQVDEAMKLYHEMLARQISPNAHTFSILINALCKENRLNEARGFLRQLNRSDIDTKPFLYNPVIDGYCKAGNVDEANVIVEEMEEKRCNPDIKTFTILIIGHCMKGRTLEAISIFHKMLSTGCAPDSIAVNSLTSCLLKAGMPNEANQILYTVSQRNLNLSSSSSRKIHSVTRNINIPVAAC